jgi:tRNA(Ile)-lysidine synthase
MNIDFCEKYNMLPKGGIVLCAVSGGKDSMYLLEKLRVLSPEYGFELVCAHFNHRLRGEESDRDQKFVEDYCEKLGIRCIVGTDDVSAFAAEKHLGTEEAARCLRYEFLEKTAEDIGAERIATAHTADDNAETLLLNLARGSGLKGLGGIPPVRGRVIRPMLQTGTAEVIRFLEENKIPHVEDSTNAEDAYTRNRIRHRIVPELRAVNDGFDENLMRCTALLREDEEYLTSLAQNFVDEYFTDNYLPASKFTALPRPVSARVLRLLLPDGLSSAHIEAVRDAAESENPHAVADICGMRVLKDYDRLIFGAKERKEIIRRDLQIGQVTQIPEAGLEISLEFIKNCKEIHNSFNIFFFQSDSICGSIFVKSREDGEKIRLNGRKCTKTLKKLFSESKLNGENRGLVPVLYDESGVLAVYGFGIAERCCPSEGDNVLKAEVRPLNADDTNLQKLIGLL